MLKKVYPFFGLAAAVCYIFTVVVGGFVAQGGYNHLIHAISELPHFLPQTGGLRIDFLFTLYGWLVVAFALFAMIDFGKSKRWLLAVSALLLELNAASGLLMALFPMDERDGPATARGAVHFALAGICAVASFMPPTLTGIYGFKRFAHRGFAVYSLISGAVTMVSGAFTAAGAANRCAYFGFIERITIGSYITWLLAFSVYLLLQHRKQREVALP